MPCVHDTTQADTDFEKMVASLNDPAAILEFAKKLARERAELCKEVRLLNETLKLKHVPTFTPFPRLPPELRLIIWELLLPGPRIVHVVISDIEWEHESWEPESKSACQIPVLLHVNHESRQLALKKYSLSFGLTRIRLWPDENPDTVTPKIYCNFDLDIIVFSIVDLRYWLDLDQESRLLLGWLKGRYRSHDEDFHRIKKLGLINNHHNAEFEGGWHSPYSSIPKRFLDKMRPEEVYFCHQPSLFFNSMSGDVDMEFDERCTKKLKELPLSVTVSNGWPHDYVFEAGLRARNIMHKNLRIIKRREFDKEQGQGGQETQSKKGEQEDGDEDDEPSEEDGDEGSSIDDAQDDDVDPSEEDVDELDDESSGEDDDEGSSVDDAQDENVNSSDEDVDELDEPIQPHELPEIKLVRFFRKRTKGNYC